MSANSFTISSRHGAARNFVVALFATALLLVAASYVLRFTVLASIAPRFTGNASFDQKLLFIKQQKFGDAPLSVVVGSSMALNNLDTDLLQQSENVRYVDIGAWSQSVPQAAQLVALFEKHFKVRELTLAVQFFEIKDHVPENLEISAGDFDGYLSDDLRLKLERPTDILDAITSKLEWPSVYGNPRAYEYLGFSKTGSVPLDIKKRYIDPARWNPKQVFSAGCEHCMAPVIGMCTAAAQQRTPFFVVLPPLTEFIRRNRPEARNASEDRRQRLVAAVADCGSRLFDADRYAEFDDSCFADFAHLNAEGSRRMTQLFLQWKRGTLQIPQQRKSIFCN